MCTCMARKNGKIKFGVIHFPKGVPMKIMKNDRNQKIIDAVEFNGRYTDAETVRNKYISAGCAAVLAICAIILPIFFL